MSLAVQVTSSVIYPYSVLQLFLRLCVYCGLVAVGVYGAIKHIRHGVCPQEVPGLLRSRDRREMAPRGVTIQVRRGSDQPLLPAGSIRQDIMEEEARGLSLGMRGRDLVLQSWGREDFQVGQSRANLRRQETGGL